MPKAQQLLLIFILLLICNTSAAQKFELFLGIKAEHNIRSQNEVVLTNASSSKAFKELLPSNANVQNIQAGVIYRFEKPFFVELNASYGYVLFWYKYFTDLERLGYTKPPFYFKLGLESGNLGLGIKGGYSIRQNGYLLDAGIGLLIEPKIPNGTSTNTIGIGQNGQSIDIAQSNNYHEMNTSISQNIFVRFRKQNSKYRLLNHLGITVGYNNKFFGRFNKSIMDVTYTNSHQSTFVNKHYDFRQSVFATVFYSF